MVDYILTYTEKRFHILDPQPDEIVLEDIAHALSRVCRYGGHTETHFSVAQHSVIVSNQVPIQHAKEGLFHDAAEAYIGDIVSPLKQYLDQYLKIEEKIERIIAKKFRLQYPWPTQVHQVDKEVRTQEKQMIFLSLGLEAKEAKELFLRRYRELFNSGGV